MSQPRLKVEWAKRHLDTLVTESAVLPADLYEIKWVPSRTVVVLAQPNAVTLTYIPKKPVPEHFALRIGDTLHNLRSSLDYWTSNAVFALSKSATLRGRFNMPFAGDRESLVKRTPAYAHIEQALPEGAAFIADELQTYQGGNGDRLHSVTTLNNADKHELILPTVVIANINIPAASVGGNIYSNCGIGADAASESKLIQVGGGIPFAIHKDIETAVHVSFPQGGLFQNKPVVPTLLNLIQAHSEALDLCERFLVKRLT
jgi:hypothetical protein